MIDPNEHLVVIASNEPWGDQWFIKHHYANELSKMGFEVIFLNPVEGWSVSGFFDKTVETSSISENLSLAKYKNPLPLRLFPDSALKYNDRVNAKKLLPLAKGKKIVLWQFDAFRFAHNFFGVGSKKIYHVADHYHDLPFDRLNAENADLIVCVSETFMDYYRSFGKPIVYIPHAVSDAEFKSDARKAETLQKNFGDYFLHAGTINDRIDLGIFESVAESFPEKNVLLIGPDKIHDASKRARFNKLVERSNVHAPGIVAGDSVKNYVAGADACLLAYDFNEVQTLGPITSSLKVLNYLAQKKPIVSSSEIEYPELIEKGLFIAKDKESYIRQLRAVLSAEKQVDATVVDEFLARHSYVKFIRDILEELDKS